MKIRFGEGLDYAIRTPPSLEDIVVPKLIIQPLIENSMKYGIDRDPPWRIDIEVQDDGERWTARVYDDGPGFPDEVIESLGKPDSGRDGGASPDSLGIGGLGLKNIEARMRLFYGESAIFAMENRPTGGACVILGGKRGNGEKI
jgi:two-component system sensor histidine kinase YesM